MIINDLDDYYIVFDTKNRNTELDALFSCLVVCHVKTLNKTTKQHHQTLIFIILGDITKKRDLKA